MGHFHLLKWGEMIISFLRGKMFDWGARSSFSLEKVKMPFPLEMKFELRDNHSYIKINDNHVQ